MDKSVWKMFSKHHYLDHNHNNAASVYICYINDQAAGFISVLPQPGAVKNLFRIHRLVVLPDYQGIGIGLKMLNDVAQLYTDINKKVSIVTSAPSLLGALNKSNKWRCIFFGKKGGINYGKLYSTAKRISASFRYKQ
jgi:GNAT superfamily N-acetyltransferase